jgi:hypothetical protein
VERLSRGRRPSDGAFLCGSLPYRGSGHIFVLKPRVSEGLGRVYGVV